VTPRPWHVEPDHRNAAPIETGEGVCDGVEQFQVRSDPVAEHHRDTDPGSVVDGQRDSGDRHDATEVPRSAVHSYT
jgi:hypothetical protein